MDLHCTLGMSIDYMECGGALVCAMGGFCGFATEYGSIGYGRTCRYSNRLGAIVLRGFLSYAVRVSVAWIILIV